LADFPDICSIQGNGSLRHIIETRDQVDQSGFSATRTSDDRGRLPRLRSKCYIVEHIFLCSGIPEGNMVKPEQSPLLPVKCLRLFRIVDDCPALKHFL